MPSPENKLLQAWFAPAFKAAGFKKTGATWHRPTPELIHVFHIQGSQWSRSFYFNLGIYITALGTLDRPPEPHCHVRERLDSIVPDRERLIQLSNFVQKLPEQQRQSELEAIVLRWAIPWLDQLTTIDQLRNYVRNEKGRGLPITMAACEHLGIALA